MADVQPFRAMRYDFARNGGDLSKVIAPPYDVLDAEAKRQLLTRDPCNIVAVDLPHLPAKDEGPEQAYLDAQFNLDMWTADGTLVREEKPAIYAYNQSFEHEGRQVTRRQYIAAVRLQEFSDGVILPHEETFGGPKADRLALTKATRCNTSSVFALYTDRAGTIDAALDPARSAAPDATATLDNVVNDIWVITDESIIKQVTQAMADKRIYIADGHHRYGTALNYRQHLVDFQGGTLDGNHPGQLVMLVLASMDDPGCVIKGYARVLSGDGINAAALCDAWSAGVAVAAESDSDMALFDGASQEKTYVKFTNRQILAELAPDKCDAWRKIDYAYLHAYLIDRLAAGHFGDVPKVHYQKSPQRACKLAGELGGVALLPNATPLELLRAVSEAGELMPQKSTFFFPKVATGLTINPLYEDE